jgi:hypothetical protein
MPSARPNSSFVVLFLGPLGLLAGALADTACGDSKVGAPDASTDAPGGLADCSVGDGGAAALEAGGILAEAGNDDASGAASDGGGACIAGDQDGVMGGMLAFDLAVTDTGFMPLILKAENGTNVTLTLKNMGTRPHGFAVQCLPTPNNNGCPTTSCFPNGAMIAPIPPGGTATATFRAPAVEGMYSFGSNAPCDAAIGQFIVD